jgi:hypothetical protein
MRRLITPRGVLSREAGEGDEPNGWWRGRQQAHHARTNPDSEVATSLRRTMKLQARTLSSPLRRDGLAATGGAAAPLHRLTAVPLPRYAGEDEAAYRYLIGLVFRHASYSPRLASESG